MLANRNVFKAALKFGRDVFWRTLRGSQFQKGEKLRKVTKGENVNSKFEKQQTVIYCVDALR